PLLALTGGVVNSQAIINKESGGQLFNTLAANLYLRPSDAKWRPYLTLGGGILNNVGGDPSIDLLSMIQAGNGSAAVNEHDLLAVRFQPQRISGVLLYGAGVKRYFGDHWGVRADLRDNMAWESVRTRIFAFPSPATGGSSSFAFTGNGREI